MPMYHGQNSCKKSATFPQKKKSKKKQTNKGRVAQQPQKTKIYIGKILRGVWKIKEEYTEHSADRECGK